MTVFGSKTVMSAISPGGGHRCEATPLPSRMGANPTVMIASAGVTSTMTMMRGD
jgi:hypothetical protein